MAVPAAAAAAAAGLRAEVTGPVATFTVRGEEDPGVLGMLGTALGDALRRLTGEVRVAVIRVEGAGVRPPDAPGHPIDPDGLADGCRAWQDALARLAARADLVSVAAVSGSTGDVGTALAVTCDLRVFTADAVLCSGYAAGGLMPVPGGLARLAALVGWPGALDIGLTGRPLGAAEAGRLGLVQRVVPAARLDDELAALVTALLATPRAVSAEVKALVRPTRPGIAADAESEAWERLAAGSLDPAG
ncbi:Enoyl-CoA hydratase/carnithine racemase [Frankia canadensis]|uniref:Enoyl-CoA hydratase/carnithine racemase n=1 Tax=Frankia canadensis TaxID=1836972 RepID=A0A2I2KT67_9ACTN|nr:enoyl-CoA hydratase/isomerase family protein [Frankia canadensis]SNQ48852.1 Enoyl-CoA hydratase/carnithine racemase [Frankia canadensis]SOU56142.1 Enoyl-CoA hydratase/carnithine racemase [Frankia canadensis]